MDKVLDQEVDLYRKGMLHEAQYLDYSFYKEKIECLVQKVGGGNVAIIDISDLNSPSLLAMKLQPFLGLNRQIELTSARANEAYNPNSKLLNKILFSQNRVFSIMRKIVPKKYSQAIKAFFMRINNSSKMIVPKEDIGVETLKTVLKNEMEFYESIAK
ncbi:hypothetical protein S7S_10555 [Isoalcanivorax pacificus W11-5]|uniref:Uncharacterized protein n=2 Tax=Isoalcanivorax TaxID=3020833 RepID=A0A0B4XQ28_9GAMM|nr:hypothetical protein S7S_10555 [Isoalcanivorax pacificus W11-5]